MSTLLRLATAGSVDDGKSTLVGRLLHDTKNVLADQMLSIERVSRERGMGAPDLALLTDGLRAEREQGITIDVAYRYFSTPNRTFILADTPGHVQYTRNTVTGISTSQVVVLLVDARHGVQAGRHRGADAAQHEAVPHRPAGGGDDDLDREQRAAWSRSMSGALIGFAGAVGALGGVYHHGLYRRCFVRRHHLGGAAHRPAHFLRGAPVRVCGRAGGGGAAVPQALAGLPPPRRYHPPHEALYPNW